MEYILSSTRFGYNAEDILKAYPCLRNSFKVVNHNRTKANNRLLEIEIKDLSELQKLSDELKADIIVMNRNYVNWLELEIYDTYRE